MKLLAETLYIAFYRAMYGPREIKPFDQQPESYQAVWLAVAKAAVENEKISA